MVIRLDNLRGIAGRKASAAVAPKPKKGTGVPKRAPRAGTFDHLRAVSGRALQRFANRQAHGPNDVGDDKNRDRNRDEFEDTDELIKRMRQLMPERFPTPGGKRR
ncbi:MAG: hypothetical protein J0H19_12300 [Rhodospirillales bacterium]|nr:hypothetical protein [Rhodospirillales bacterium]